MLHLYSQNSGLQELFRPATAISYKSSTALIFMTVVNSQNTEQFLPKTLDLGARKTIGLVNFMAPNTAFRALAMCRPVNRADISNDNEESCCHAVVKALMPSQPLVARGTLSSINRCLETSMRGKCRRRQLKDPLRKLSWGKGQATKTHASTCFDVRSKKTWDSSTYTCQGHNPTWGKGVSGSNNATGPSPKRIKYVYKGTGQPAEPFRVEDLQERLGCLSIAFENKPLRAVSPGIEEAYIQGEPLTPPEIEFSEDSDMEDDYWTWDQDTQRFRHWDGELGDWVCFPERFD